MRLPRALLFWFLDGYCCWSRLVVSREGATLLVFRSPYFPFSSVVFFFFLFRFPAAEEEFDDRRAADIIPSDQIYGGFFPLSLFACIWWDAGSFFAASRRCAAFRAGFKRIRTVKVEFFFQIIDPVWEPFHILTIEWLSSDFTGLNCVLPSFF